jgi:hypothetical protein
MDFYIHTYRQDPTLVIGACKKHFHHARVFLLVDGDDHTYQHTPCVRFPERLKPLPNGGAWVKRWFTFAVAQGSDIAFKIDPDSKVHRPFHAPPPDADLFGSLLKIKDRYLVHGGSMGLRRDFMIRAIPLLADERYKAREFSMCDGTSSSDKIITDLADRLNVPLTPWGEVTYFPFPWSGTRYAISHGRWHKDPK